ncbi:hypothetical protein [Paenarthrobacter sp. NPDC018779]|uniref:hypothetical protein n=1 Tax=Paenarthrobacter sp. NPDC018779 TaxID=3364375 RepID=UPI0037C8217F
MSIVLETGEAMEQGRQYGEEAMLRRLGQLARQRREELGLGRVPFAQQNGMGSNATMRDFEFGKIRPTAITLRRIEKGLQWKPGVIDEKLEAAEKVKAEDVRMEDLDSFDSAPKTGLDQYTTPELLRALAERLETLQAGLGGAVLPKDLGTKDLYGMAASGHIPEHLESEYIDSVSTEDPDAN